jgi:hypothetical protein
MDIEQLKEEEDNLRQEISALSMTDKQRYYKIERKLIKDPDTYAVLNWFLPAGLHHFYLGNLLRGAFNLTIMFIGCLLLTVNIAVGVAIIILIFLIELPQLFRSQSIVHAHNNKMMKQALGEVHSDVEH